jgi:hypothetical protein
LVIVANQFASRSNVSVIPFLCGAPVNRITQTSLTHVAPQKPKKLGAQWMIVGEAGVSQAGSLDAHWRAHWGCLKRWDRLDD